MVVIPLPFKLFYRTLMIDWKMFVLNNKVIVLKKDVEHLYASVIADELSPKETISKEEKEVSSFSLNRLLSFIDRRMN